MEIDRYTQIIQSSTQFPDTIRALPPPPSCRILIVDNYDSFTYNLVHLCGILARIQPICIYNNQYTYQQLLQLIQQHQIDCIIISPGPGRLSSYLLAFLLLLYISIVYTQLEYAVWC